MTRKYQGERIQKSRTEIIMLEIKFLLKYDILIDVRSLRNLRTDWAALEALSAAPDGGK